MSQGDFWGIDNECGHLLDSDQEPASLSDLHVYKCQGTIGLFYRQDFPESVQIQCLKYSKSQKSLKVKKGWDKCKSTGVGTGWDEEELGTAGVGKRSA